jgi:hypothetical protein
LLLDVTATLTASSTLGSVAGAFVMPESLQRSSQLTVVAASTMGAEQSSFMQAMDAATAARSADPNPIVGPQPTATRVSAAKLPSLRGTELLGQLGLLDRSQLSKFVTQNPKSVAALIASPPAATAVANTWAGWSPATRSAMVAKAPQLVGSLEGFPYSQRDIANRLYLDAAENQIDTQLKNGVGRAAKDELTARLHMLQKVRTALKVGSSGTPRELISLDATGGGKAVISLGNASTADYVDYLIPGMFSDVDTQITVLAGGADMITSEQKAWLAKLNPGVPASQLPTVATFAWIGYQTPNIVNVASMQLAREGEASLTSSIEGLRAVRSAAPSGTQPYVAILAHSYGSTAAMLALQDNDVSVDALAVVGSPGSPARTAGDLKVTDGNVWVGAAAADPVPETGLFGSQPLSPAYGAHVFGVNGAQDPLSGKSMRASVGHNDYFVAGTEALRNLVLIGIGRGDLVLGDDGQSALTGKALAAGKVHAAAG